MSCDHIMELLNDYLNKTLPENEEQLVKRHLEKCASCRTEYYNLLHADQALRQVVCEMVAEIDVPQGLSVDIEQAIARESRTGSSCLAMWLKTPLVAAALLFVVMAGVLGAYQNHFNPFAQQQVARQVQDEEKPGAGALFPAAKGKMDSADTLSPAAKGEMDSVDTVSPANQPVAPPDQGPKEEESIVRQQTLALKEPEERPLENRQEIRGGRQVDPAEDTARPELNAPPSGEEQSKCFVTSAPAVPADSAASAAPAASAVPADPAAPAAGGGDMAAANGPIADNEVYAKETGAIDSRSPDFVPAKPHYLPLGAIPVNVTSAAGEISRDYQAGHSHFTVRQTRLGADEQVPLKKSARVANNVDVVDINGRQGFMERSQPGDDHYTGTVTTLRWQQGDWAFTVSGDLPEEEIIKISQSLR